MKKHLMLYLLLLCIIQVSAQTIPKSIDKPPPVKTQPQQVKNNAAASRADIMNKRSGRYAFQKMSYFDQKMLKSEGYIEISYRNDKLYIKGFVDLHFTHYYQMQKLEETYKGPFEWSGRFRERTAYAGGSVGYTFWNGDGNYLKTEIKRDNGKDVEFLFVEVYENYVYISMGSRSFFFNR